MAERILFSIAGNVLTGMGSLALQELNLGRKAKAELTKLKGTVSTIKAILLDAEEQHNNNNHEVTLWLERLKDVIYDVDDFLDDLSTKALQRKAMNGNGMIKEVCIFFSNSNQLVYRFKMGHRIQDLREVLDYMAIDRHQFGFINRREVYSQTAIREIEQTHSSVLAEEVIGRDVDKEAIIKLLLETNPDQESVRVIPIVGIGGQGKTTLAQMVFNDEKVKAQFELIMWVCVSDRFEVKIVVKQILEAVSKSKTKELDFERLQSELRDKINGKKYFLVLDDVWNEDVEKWSKVKSILLGGAKGSRIVLTTRSEKIGDITRTNGSKIYLLGGLVKDKSLSLFEKIAFENQTQTPTQKDLLLRTFGVEIEKVCGGVPLAIRAIGSVLHFKRTKAEWSSVLESVPQKGTGIEPILKRSYDHLPSHLKQCFAYCSLFPKDYEINKHVLINLWMAQGFIKPLTKRQSLEDVGHGYFMELLWRSFFQEAKEDEFGNIESCKMHDLMHDLAKSVTGSECSLITNLDVEDVEENTRHVSLGEEFDCSWEIPSALLGANKMRTFFQVALWGIGLSESNYNAIVESFRCLRMLDLKGSVFEELPHPICKLKHLRYLDLSQNSELRKLLNFVTRLYNLQTLDLRRCMSFEEWPREIRKWVSLRHLYIEGCHNLGYMPRGLGEVTCLTTLDQFIVGMKIDSDKRRGGVSELNGLNNLRGQLKIEALGNAIPEIGAAYLKDKLYLDSLILDWETDEEGAGAGVNDEKVLENLGPHPNLKELDVREYKGGKFSNWLSSITSLVKLELWDCSQCRNLPPMDHLPSLKSLKLELLGDLEYVSSETKTEKSTTVEFFPSLESLEILGCPKLKGWWKENEDEDAEELMPCFPRLSTLIIQNCPKLVSFPLFPNLTRSLELYDASVRLLKQTISMRNKSSSAPLPLSFLKSLTLKKIQDVDMESMLEELLLNCRCTRLESLKIKSCDGLTMFPREVNANNTLTSLQMLDIRECTNLMALPNWIPNLTSLQELWVYNCPKLPSLPQGMSRLTNLPRMDHLPSLKSLVLWDLYDLEHVWETKTEKSTTMNFLRSLESLSTTLCPKLKGWWKEIEDEDEDEDEATTTSEELLPCFPRLSTLNISGCPNLTSFPLFPNLTQRLSLSGTSGMALQQKIRMMRSKSSSSSSSIVPHPLSNLKSLVLHEIQDVESLLEELLLNCCTCLESLKIISCPGLTMLPKEVNANCLTSLRYLEISFCTNLMDLPNWITNLTSLQYLRLPFSVILSSLPQGMSRLTNLQYLQIHASPQLKERCQRDTGADWPQISHIPELHIG